MKIRSNAAQIWSISGFTLLPGKVVPAPTDVKLLAEIKRLVGKGLISVVEADTEVIAPEVTKVEAIDIPAEKPTQQPSLLDINKIIVTPTEPKTLDIEIVQEKGTEIPIETIIEASTLETPAITKETVTAPQDTAIIDNIGLEATTDMGEVLIPGKFPGEAVLQKVSDRIAESTDAIKSVLADTAKELEALQPKPTIIKLVPERTQRILDMNINKRKIEISKISDVEFLKEIAENTDNQKIQKIITQRLEEIK